MPGIIQQQGTTLDASPNPVDIAQISQAGSPVSSLNPFPVSIAAIGPITIGKVDQGAPNTTANGWPVYLEISGTAITGTTNAGQLSLNVNLTGGSSSVTQGTTPWVDNITQFGSNAVVTGTGASGLGIPRVTVSNDSNILATQSGTWNINNITGTVSLPTGASTAANQVTEIAALGTINTTLGSPMQNTGGTVTVIQPSGANLHVDIDNFPGTQPVSGTVVANQGTPNSAANGWPVYLEVGGVPVTGTVVLGQMSLNTNITGGVVSGSFTTSGLTTGLKSQKVIVTDVATAIPLPINSLANRNGITIRVKGINPVYFGDSTVTAAQGYYKYTDEEIQLDIKNNAAVIIYGICDTGLSSEIRIMEVA